MIERLAKNATMHFEFGPKTRETLKSLRPKEPNKRDGEGLLRKGADAPRKERRISRAGRSPRQALRRACGMRSALSKAALGAAFPRLPAAVCRVTLERRTFMLRRSFPTAVSRRGA
jgi:hypothetical protein